MRVALNHFAGMTMYENIPVHDLKYMSYSLHSLQSGYTVHGGNLASPEVPTQSPWNYNSPGPLGGAKFHPSTV